MPFSVFYQLSSVRLSSEDTMEKSRKSQTKNKKNPSLVVLAWIYTYQNSPKHFRCIWVDEINR